MQRLFAVVGKNTGKRFEIEAGCFKDLVTRAGHRSRTETVRELRKGNAFFIQRREKRDYHIKMDDFGSFNVMLEALRNLNDAEGKDSYGACIMLCNGTQYFHTSFPENPDMRRMLSKELNEELSKGAVIIISKNPEK